MKNYKYAIALGNAFDGITFIGPFNSHEDATYYIDREGSEEDWHIVPMESPKL